MENKETKTKNFWQMAGKVLNVSWKIAVVIIGVFILTAIIGAVYDVCVRDHGRYAHRCDRKLTENITVHYLKEYKCRVYDIEKGEYVTPRFRWVSDKPERDSLTVFCDMDDKRGFLNVNNGEIVIEGRYSHAWVFSEGLAAVVEPDGKMGFIDKTGQYVINPTLDYIYSHDYVFKHGVCCIENKHGKQGLINTEGEWVFPQEYDFISYITEADMFVVTQNDKKGVVRNGGFEWVYPMEYDDIRWLNSPAGEGFVMYKDFSSKLVALDGTVIESFLIDDASALQYMVKYNQNDPDEYVISDKLIEFKVNGLCGVMDKHTGKVIVPAMYYSVSMESENILKFRLNKYRYQNFVLYDVNGNKIEE